MSDGLQYAQNLIEAEWHEEISGRDYPVPEPNVIREGSESYRLMDPQQNDIVLIRDGGDTNVEPQSVGWHEEAVTSRVTVDIRTSHSRERLWGYRNEDNEPERYGGLTGEIKRIFDTVRRGEHEYDLVIVEEILDLSGEMGGLVWRASITVTLDIRAQQIDPEP